MNMLLKYAWEAISAVNQDSDNEIEGTASWCFQMLISSSEKIYNSTTGANFPHRQILPNLWIYEFNGPALKGDMSNSIGVTIEGRKNYKLVFKKEDVPKKPNSQLAKFEVFFDQIMDTMLFILRDQLKNEKFKMGNHYWSDLLGRLFDRKNVDPAKYALIADLARPGTLMEPLRRVSEKPKRVLRRIHELERVQKVREIDTRCLIDLARQPGSVLAEKAGPKQRILAIRRTESIDTLENRVARHCCDLAVRASRRYLLMNSKITPLESERVHNVSKLQRFSKLTPLKNSFKGVSRLIEPCRQPNYSLLQNTDYLKIWEAYSNLVKNEDLRNQLWIWNRRLWKDYTSIFLSEAIQSVQSELGDELMIRMGKKTILAERKHEAGSWFLSDMLSGPYVINPDSEHPGTVYLIDGSYESLTRLSSDLGELAVLNADFLVLNSENGRVRVLPIYSMLPSNHISESEQISYINDVLPSLMKNIKKVNHRLTIGECLGGWVLLGNWGDVTTNSELKNLGEGITCWITSVSADYQAWMKDKSLFEQPLLSICGLH